MSWLKMKKKWWIGLLTLSLLLGSVGVAWAEPPAQRMRRAPRRPALRGRVTAIDGTTLSVTVWRGAFAVLTGEETRFRVPDTEQATLADIQVGDRVAVWGKRETRCLLRARLILVIPEGAITLRGEVTAIEGDGFRLQTRQGEQTVRVDDETRFRLPGVEDPSLDDLLEGAKVLIAGIKNQDEGVLARIVGVRLTRPSSPRDERPLP